MANYISLILAFSILVVIAGGLWNRIALKLGIGWQFIRFNVIAIGLLVAAILALNSMLTAEAATIISATLGYAFGKSGKDE